MSGSVCGFRHRQKPAKRRQYCRDKSLSQPGPVEIAETGHWQNSIFSFTGGPGPNRNHAKIGVSLDEDYSYAIFGDMNQQGKLSGNCASSQNGRGGLFYIVPNKSLNQSISSLIQENQ